MGRSVKLIVFACVISLVLSSGQPKAENDPRTYNVGIFHLPPWGEPDGQGGIKGVIYEFFEMISEESGLAFDYKLVPYARMVNDIGTGKIDFAIFLERPDTEIDYTRLTTTTFEEIIIYCRDLPDGGAWRDIGDVVVAVPRGVNFGDKFRRKRNLTEHFIRHYETSLDLYMSGRVDCFIGPKSALFHHFRRLGISPSTLPEPISVDLQEAFIHAPTHKLSELPIEQITEAVNHLRAGGRLHNVLIKYYGVEGITHAPLPALHNYTDDGPN